MYKSIFTALSLSMIIGCAEHKSNFQYKPIANNSSDFVYGEISLDLKDDLSELEIKNMSDEYGFVIRDSSPIAHSLGNLEVMDILDNDKQDIIDRLSRDPRVEIAEPTIIVKALYQPNDELYPDQWGMKSVGVNYAWNYTSGSNGTLVAVIDTGIDQSIPDLKNATFIPGYNFIDGNSDTKDRQSHGSHVCSTIVETPNNRIGGIGLAPNVKIMPVKALSDSGSGTAESVASSIMFAAKNGAQVINLSLGSSQKSAIIAKAIKFAHDQGVFVAVAAGNDNSPITGSPSSDDGAFAVAASDKNGNKANFSSYGKEVKISAPGVNILQSTVSRDGKGTPVYEAYNGTSMASPFFAALGALVYSQGVTDPDSALEVIQSNAVQKNDPIKFGAGIMDAKSSVKSVFFRHLGLRAVFLAMMTFVIAVIFKKNKLEINPHYAKYFGALWTSVGLLWFLPLLGVLPYMGNGRIVGELLTKPLGDWDLLINVSYHKWMFLASSFPAFLLVAFGYHRPALRSFAGGVAIGTSAYLAQVAFSGEVNFIMGMFAMRIWSIINIFICLWVAKNTLIK